MISIKALVQLMHETCSDSQGLQSCAANA